MGSRKNPRKTLTPKRSAPVGQRYFESILSEKNPPDKQEFSSSEFIVQTDDSRYLPVPLNVLKIIACPSQTTILRRKKPPYKRSGNQVMVIKVRRGITPVEGKEVWYALNVQGPKRRQVNQTHELIIKCSLKTHPEQNPCTLCEKHGVECSGGMSSDKRRSIKVDHKKKDVQILASLVERHGEGIYDLLKQAFKVSNEKNKSSVGESSPERTS